MREINKSTLLLNKHFLVFIAIFLFLALVILTFFQKIFYMPLHLTADYCHEIIHSLSLEIPHNTGSIVLIVPVAIMILLFSKIALSYIQVFRLRERLVLVEIQDQAFLNVINKCELKNKVQVVSDINPTAFCLGILNPRIYISTKMIELMNDKELEAILVHENYHLKNRDSFIMFFATVTKILFPFFPIITDLILKHQFEREVKADQAAIQVIGGNHALISVLKRLLTFGNSVNPTYAFSPAIASFDTLEERIKILVNIKRNKVKISAVNMLLSFLSIIVISIAILLPVHAVEIHNDTKDTLIISLEENNKNKCSNTAIDSHATPPALSDH